MSLLQYIIPPPHNQVIISNSFYHAFINCYHLNVFMLSCHLYSCLIYECMSQHIFGAPAFENYDEKCSSTNFLPWLRKDVVEIEIDQQLLRNGRFIVV